jgi:hypothetical protein
VQNPALLRSGAHHNWLRNLTVHDAGSLHFEGAVDNRLEGSRFERMGNEAANSGDAVFVKDGASRNLIVRNAFVTAGHGAIWVSYNSSSEPTSDDNIIAHNDIANPWASALGLNGTANRTLVECNVIHHTANGSGVNYARDGVEIEGTNNIVRFNVIHSIGASGLSLEGRSFGGRVQNARGNHIYNNTFYGMGAAAVEMIQKDVGVVQNNIIENNILWQATGFAFGGTTYAMIADQYNANTGNVWSSTSASGNIVRNNIIPTGQSLLLLIRNSTNGNNVSYTLAQAASTLGWGANLASDPQLTAAPSDVTLRSTSPAIDAGIAISGVSYLGAAPDLGAKEAR